ncbi:MAG: hypothetical protein WC523_06895 [Patescibacteria group bacterium]
MNKIIDCSFPPEHINGLREENHTRNSFIGSLDTLNIKTHLIPQSEVKRIENSELKIFPNSNLLNFYLKNPELIPQEWNECNGIIFLGTSYFSEEDGTLTYCGIGRLNGNKENPWVLFSASSLNLFPISGEGPGRSYLILEF